ncbi:MAG: GtrA family protein [Pseudomonadota bacterium]
MGRFAELVRFGIVGLGATGVHASVAGLMHAATGLPADFNNCLGFAAAFGVSLFGHLRWTFRTEAHPGQAARRFFAIAIAGFFASALIMRLALGPAGAALWQAQALAILIVPPVSFLGSKFWAFRGRATA